MDMQIAQTILNQLGGSRFIAMTGAKDFVADERGLKFRLPKLSNGINTVRVTLLPSDTYSMSFMKIGRAPNFTMDIVDALENVYCDQLQEIFTSKTGLHTHL